MFVYNLISKATTIMDMILSNIRNIGGDIVMKILQVTKVLKYLFFLLLKNFENFYQFCWLI